MRPKLLDLYCGAGGASFGYNLAGFDVVGVDIKPQPRYPFRFIQTDAIEALKRVVDREFLNIFRPGYFDAIHASPPCQAFTNARVIHKRKHPDLLGPTRDLLQRCGISWVIENVPGAPMRADALLCGSMFGQRKLIRHRCFEFNEPKAFLLPACDHAKETISVFGHGGHVYHGVAEWREIMGIDWMTRDELAQAIPPYYTEFIGKQLIENIKRATPTERTR